MNWQALALLTWTTLCGPTWANEPRPNVVVIITDDQGYGDLSCHGNPIAATPHIDRLASQSVRLTDFHVAPMCTPTRGQLLTGLDAFRNGAINVSSGRTLLRPELRTMADVFKSAGYRTGIFGKWHLGDNYPFRPEDRGFDEAIWFPSSHIGSCPDFWQNDYFDDTYMHNGRREKFDGYCTDVFFREAIDWIGSEAEQPFFAYIPLNAPHGPLYVPDQYRDAVRQRLKTNPEIASRLTPQRLSALVSFLAMVANIDDNVGRLDRFLTQRGLLHNTIVVFLNDNGSTMGPDYFNAGMRGSKTTLWEGGHRVSCFIRWPAGLERPRDVAQLSHVQDLLPTLADLTGTARFLPDRLDGQSLGPILRGDAAELPDRMLVINYSRMPPFKVTYTTDNPAIPKREGACVMWKQWRLLEDRWLYDVAADPHQDRDVAGDHPEVVEKMRSHLTRWWDGVRDSVMEPQRVVIGHAAENPMMLSACEWLDVFVDQQAQVRRGERKNGVWHLTVTQDGKYEFELRRWPRESGLKLDEACAETRVSDGTLAAGAALPIAQARLKIDGVFDETAAASDDRTAVRFQTTLRAGPIQLQSWMLDAAGDALCGAYYVYVNRVK